MQSDVEVEDYAITGTLLYLDSGAIAEYWGAGNFMALTLANNDFTDLDSVKVGLRPTYGGAGGTTPIDDDSGLVEIIDDPDKNGVFMINDNATQKFIVVQTKGAQSRRDEYSLAGLTLEPEDGV